MTHYNALVLVPGNVTDVEDEVSKLMAPHNANLESIPYPRECECVYDSALNKLKSGSCAFNGRVNGPLIEFTKEVFDQAGPEIVQKLEFLRMGSPDSQCEDCKGSGISTTTHNCRTEWDSWEILPALTVDAFKDCLKSDASIAADQTTIPVSALDLDKVTGQLAVVTPDGAWHSHKKFIWFSNAVIVDENWEQTVRNLLKAHPDAMVVLVDYHI